MLGKALIDGFVKTFLDECLDGKADLWVAYSKKPNKTEVKLFVNISPNI
jgi:hypothetical protein